MRTGMETILVSDFHPTCSYNLPQLYQYYCSFVYNYYMGIITEGVTNHVRVDSITGPHVSVIIGFPQNHTRKSCNLTFGYNDTLQTSALSSREDGDEIEYALHSIVAGQTYAYSLECSVDIRVDGNVSEMKFTDQGNFKAGMY